MKKLFIKVIWAVALLTVMIMPSCKKDKIFFPNDQITSEQVYANAQGYKQAIGKAYAAFALTGNSGPTGSGDIQGIDEGASDFFRLFWCAQELTTDEAVVSFKDTGLPDFHNMSWSASNPFLQGLYYRSTYQITLCNEFIRQSTDDQLSKRGISGTDADDIRHYRAEARFLRAYQYWVLMDLYGNPPFATEDDALGAAPPKQIDRKALYTYVVSELQAIVPAMVAPRMNEYGRADQAAAWSLLARIYLNAEIYTGTADYANAITYSQKVINAGYTLMDNYTNLMLADNNLNNSEFILTINYDGNQTQNYGGTTFLVHAEVGGSMPVSSFGITGGWAGLRVTSNIVNLFPANPTVSFPTNGNPDTRAEFWTKGQNLDINTITAFSDGYAVTKFRNVTKTGQSGSNPSYEDIDMPVFRLPEMYLIYAEAVLRGGAGGDMGTALGYINNMRNRAYSGTAAGNISTAQLTLDFILDERARELYWEGFRRSDLIRYSRFTDGSYLWPFKAGVKTGTNSQPFRNIFPLPSSDLNVNPNLKQNNGY
ncbi:RagB/SusD family nutrient uptake outer membrane protein [Pedobacter sp. L105]|uniref:RagB/SusD family nutrient uptake outer membrane protein n=1 Tax=Pedobacter sp. L105 TaxID=1641871 RepID=UPI00131B6DA8|nr:RagB/SusD family nutrient uptake outer membrane protein [Pedobacter sp. L105]